MRVNADGLRKWRNTMGEQQDKGAEGQDGGKADAYVAPATQADFDRMIAERISRERAKFGDYDVLKDKAGKFDQLEEANKTELQKVTDRAEKAERERDELAARQALAAHVKEVATATGVPADLLRGGSKEELEAHAETLKSHISSEGTKKTASIGPYVPPEGTNPGASGQTTADAFAEAVGSALN